MKKKFKGFTLVELLAAMAIIAILIGLAGFGISLALRNSRDTERKEILNNMQLVINDYYTRQNAYPNSAARSGSTIVFRNAALQPVGDAVPVEGNTTPAGTTTSNGTAYRYAPSATGYMLCVKLENGDWFDLSSNTNGCETSTIAVIN